MSALKNDGKRLDHLREAYRTAFREWTAARRELGESGRGENGGPAAHAQEVAAALAYTSARNHLSKEMSRSRDRNRGGSEAGRAPVPGSTRAPGGDTERWEYVRDFALVLVLIGLAVAGGTLLANVVSLAK